MSSFKIEWMAARATSVELRRLSSFLVGRSIRLLGLAACLLVLVPGAMRLSDGRWSLAVLAVSTVALLYGARQMW